ncbi:MAG: TraR/DksA C4-type zinc finger protein [Patescibacteria group bacterium]
MSFSTEQITRFSEKLLNGRKEIKKRLEELQKTRDYGDDTDSYQEEGDETTEFSNQVELVESLKTRTERIDTALQKIKDGTYGICETCKQPIPLAVLEVDPESELCQDCKLRQTA